MPTAVYPAAHGADPWAGRGYRQASSAGALLNYTLMDDPTMRGCDSPGSSRRATTPKQLIQSSFEDVSRSDRIFAAKNGFVHAALEAYNSHHHLVLRPEDIWFSILTQLSCYVNAHADTLKSILVTDAATSGAPRELHIETDISSTLVSSSSNNSDGGSGGGGGGSSSRSSSVSSTHSTHSSGSNIRAAHSKVDHGLIAYQMTKLMAENLQDGQGLREWVLPAFTTTTKVDQAVASILFMGTMQKYFTYSWGTRCGIPSVTLLGEASDWIKIRQRAERLASFATDDDRGLAGGKTGTASQEPTQWLSLLRPVLDGFVQSFTEPKSEQTRRFWQSICDEHIPNGSGSTTYSGWITAFCFWDEDGSCLHKNPTVGSSKQQQEKSTVRLTRGQLPIGFTKVPVTLLDQGNSIPTEVLAGSLAIKASPSSTSSRAVVDTIQPEIGWFMYRT